MNGFSVLLTYSSASTLVALRCCFTDGYNGKLAHFWKKSLKPLLKMLFELPWRRIVPFEGWEERRKRFLKKSSQEHFFRNPAYLSS